MGFPQQKLIPLEPWEYKVDEYVEDFTSQSRFGSLFLDFAVLQVIAKATFHSTHGCFRLILVLQKKRLDSLTWQ